MSKSVIRKVSYLGKKQDLKVHLTRIQCPGHCSCASKSKKRR